MITELFRDLFRDEERSKPRPDRRVVLHLGKDGNWYASYGHRKGNDFDTKFVLSVEEASASLTTVRQIAQEAFPGVPQVTKGGQS